MLAAAPQGTGVEQAKPFPTSGVYQQLPKSEPPFEKCWCKIGELKGKAASRDAPKIAAVRNTTAHLAQLTRTYLHMFRPTGLLNTLLSFQSSKGNNRSLSACQGNSEHCRHPFSTGGQHRHCKHLHMSLAWGKDSAQAGAAPTEKFGSNHPILEVEGNMGECGCSSLC